MSPLISAILVIIGAPKQSTKSEVIFWITFWISKTILWDLDREIQPVISEEMSLIIERIHKKSNFCQFQPMKKRMQGKFSENVLSSNLTHR